MELRTRTRPAPQRARQHDSVGPTLKMKRAAAQLVSALVLTSPPAVRYGTAAAERAERLARNGQLFLQLLDGGPLQPGDVHLRDAKPLGDLGLGQLIDEAQVHDPSLAWGQ